MTINKLKRSTASLLRHQTYYNALYSETSSTVTMQQIRSIGHTLYSMSLTKTGLSPYDDKRYVLSDTISTLAFGHYKINSSSNRDGEGEACARPPPPPPNSQPVCSFERRESASQTSEQTTSADNEHFTKRWKRLWFLNDHDDDHGEDL